MKKPQHVKDWERVQRLFEKRAFGVSPEEAQHALLDEWSTAEWEINFMGKVLRGNLTSINHADSVCFTLTLEPELDGVLQITGWYENFRQVKDTEHA